MTIFKANLVEKKDKKDIQLPEVVTDNVLLIENEKNEAIVVGSRLGSGNRVRLGPKLAHICLAFIITSLGLLCFAVSIWFYQHYQHQREFDYIGHCGVGFHQRLGATNKMLPMFGSFEEEVSLGEEVERIQVPSIGLTNQAIILHDFNMNWTVIVDEAKGVCFILNLDRNLVKPPTNMRDLLDKLMSGHFLIDAEVLSAKYKVVTPALVELSVYGEHISSQCSDMSTYRLAKEGEPVAMSKKRSACMYSGEKYCLGNAGYNKMLCLEITSCL